MATRRWLVSAIGVGLSLWSVGLAGDPSEHVTVGHAGSGKEDARSCSVDDLLPLPSKHKRSSEWSDENMTRFPYDCTCAQLKSR